MKSLTNKSKKSPPVFDAERGINLCNNADTVRQNDDLVYQPRVLNAGISGHDRPRIIRQ